jgi:hypothetical protein
MLDLYTLDRDGNPVRCADWVTWATTKFRLAHTPVGAGYVSTIFLGWEPGRRHADPPLLFETMILGIDGLDFEERYATRGAALEGHARAVTAARQAIVAAAGPDTPPQPAA